MEVYTGDQKRGIVGLYISEEEKDYINELLFVLRAGDRGKAFAAVQTIRCHINAIKEYGIEPVKKTVEEGNIDTKRLPAIGNARSNDPYDWYTDMKRILDVIEGNERNLIPYKNALKYGCLKGRNKGKPLSEVTRKNYERHIHCINRVNDRLREKLNDIQRPASPVLRLVS